MSARPRPPLTVLLLDLDGVLLRDSGYHRTLIEAVDLLGRALGFPAVGLERHTIDVFEAAGVTSEWDSSAICAALLLERAWTEDPGLRLPVTPPLALRPANGLTPPDLGAFAQRMLALAEPEASPLARAERLLLEAPSRHTPHHEQALRGLLRKARSLDGLTFRLVQELNLGSQAFETSYGLPAALGCASRLATHDRPALAAAGQAALRAWLREPGRRAAVMTNRPSRPPAGYLSPPEAELGLRAAGFPDLPVAAMGGMGWLAQQRGFDEQALLKPSPAHALAALRLALGEPLEAALEAAAALALDGRDDGGWGPLDRARVLVFEDAAKGLTSAARAADLLERCGVRAALDLRGVASDPAKAAALRQAGGRVFADLAAALAGLM